MDPFNEYISIKQYKGYTPAQQLSIWRSIYKIFNNTSIFRNQSEPEASYTHLDILYEIRESALRHEEYELLVILRDYECWIESKLKKNLKR